MTSGTPSNFPRASESFKKANPAIFSAPSDTTILSVKEYSGIKRGSPKKTKTEREFEIYLEALKTRGDISRYEFQGITLTWGRDKETGQVMRYTPDFVVFEVGGGGLSYVPKLIEIKGRYVHYQQQALARFKGCRSDWPEFRFEMHQKTKEGWKRVL